MFKRSIHIILALLLVVTTTGSVWGQLLEDKKDPIELNTAGEADSEKGEKESKTEFDDSDNEFTRDSNEIVPEHFCGLQKVGSSSYAPSGIVSSKLYLLYQHLKLDC